MRSFIFIPAIILLNFSILFAGNTILPDSNNAEIKKLSSLKASYKGKTAEGNSYQLYAIRNAPVWIYIIVDSTSHYSMMQTNKNRELQENTEFFTSGVNKIINLGLYKLKASKKKKKKKSKDSDFDLECYYQLKGKGKKLFKNLLYLEYQTKIINTPSGFNLSTYEKKVNETEKGGNRINNQVKKLQKLERKIQKQLSK